MGLLARREFAVSELHGKLCAKWRGVEDIRELADELVAELAEEGALSDERYVAAFIRSREQRNQGPNKIRAELRQRQLPAALVEQALQRDNFYWIDLAASWLSRQQGCEMGFEDRAKFYRRLVNRGFNHVQAMGALEQQSKAGGQPET